MKANNLLKYIAVIPMALILSQVQAEEKITPGPKGGRLLENDSPRAEFYLEKDRTVTVTFYDENLKPTPIKNQSVTVIAEAPKGKETIALEKKGDVLVSKTPLPEGNSYNVVVQLKDKPDAKAKNFRIVLNTDHCGGCKLSEYACTCGH